MPSALVAAALTNASTWYRIGTVKLLLQHPDININLKSIDDKNFIDILEGKNILIDYDLQKKILENGRDDIILFLNEYGFKPIFKEKYNDRPK